MIEAVVELTSSLQGSFSLYVCPEAGSSDLQACLSRHPLPLADSSHNQQFQYLPPDGRHIARVKYWLPAEMLCTRCVILWRLVVST